MFHRCNVGYYGDPRLGMDIPCRPCPCPDTQESGHSFANQCSLDPRTQDVVCECQEGYAGRTTLKTSPSCFFFLCYLCDSLINFLNFNLLNAFDRFPL